MFGAMRLMLPTSSGATPKRFSIMVIHCFVVETSAAVYCFLNNIGSLRIQGVDTRRYLSLSKATRDFDKLSPRGSQ